MYAGGNKGSGGAAGCGGATGPGGSTGSVAGKLIRNDATSTVPATSKVLQK
jgi:hypothetical protein